MPDKISELISELYTWLRQIEIMMYVNVKRGIKHICIVILDSRNNATFICRLILDNDSHFVLVFYSAMKSHAATQCLGNLLDMLHIERHVPRAAAIAGGN